MAADSNAHSIYISEWSERHWISSIFAPQAQILQAVTRHGDIASGIGETRVQALDRCLGETVEGLARVRGSGVGDMRPFDGVAAGQSAASAKTRAWFEAVERVEISHWWAGRREARQVPPEWLARHGFARWVGDMRALAYARRETALWRVNSGNGLTVIICKTCSPTGQDPVLGFGAAGCAFEAVGHALREALLMEVNLIELLAVRGGYSETDTTPIEAKLAAYGQRTPDLLRDMLADMPDAPARGPALTEAAERMPEDARFTQADFEEDWTVVTCQLSDPAYRTRGQDHPFMSTPSGKAAQ